MTTAQTILGTLATLDFGRPEDFSPDDWDNSAQRLIHAALLKVGPGPDPRVLRAALAPEPESFWGPELATIYGDCVFTPQALEALRLLMRAERDNRTAKRTALDIVDRLDSGLVATDVYPFAEALIRSCTPHESEEPEHVAENLAELFEGSDEDAVPLGLDCLRGLKCLAGSLTVFAARPGGGKSAMLVQACLAAALAGWRCLFLTLEMPKKQIRQRMLANLHEMSLGDIVHPKDHALVPKLEALKGLPILLRDTVGKSALNLPNIASHIRHFAGGRCVVFVDYLQLVQPGSRIDKRHEAIGHVCRELKQLALACDLPIIAAAQLGRGVEQRGTDKNPAKPRMSDLRESGDIEATADNIVLMHQTPTVFEVPVTKQRMGPKFNAECRFIPEQCRFEDFGI